MTVDAGPFKLGDIGGHGPAVLCIHGLTGTPYEVRQPAEVLAKAGFACWGPLLPGHGTSAAELAQTTRRQWIDTVVAAYDELARTHHRIYVLGLSLGGLLALALMLRRPVSGAVLLATPLKLKPLARLLVPLLAPFIRVIPKSHSIHDPEAKRRHPSYTQMPLAGALELLRLQRDLKRDLHRISAPLCLIYSLGDPTVPYENAQQLASAVTSPECELHTLSKSAHVLPVDVEREEVAQHALRFFSHLEGDGAY